MYVMIKLFSFCKKRRYRFRNVHASSLPILRSPAWRMSEESNSVNALQNNCCLQLKGLSERFIPFYRFLKLQKHKLRLIGADWTECWTMNSAWGCNDVEYSGEGVIVAGCSTFYLDCRHNTNDQWLIVMPKNRNLRFMLYAASAQVWYR